ncbi:MAG TPA: hypothetical protein VEL74_00110 [Thermoanaerobaculia bacterium]|nr:hypothetical protein [Thermoanaerobaculia bacterium]
MVISSVTRFHSQVTTPETRCASSSRALLSRSATSASLRSVMSTAVVKAVVSPAPSITAEVSSHQRSRPSRVRNLTS